MKKIYILLTLLCVVSIMPLLSQTKQGQWIVGISSRYSLSPIEAGFSTPDMMTLGFASIKVKSDDGGSSDATRFFCFNLVPRAGYFVINNLEVGGDLQFASYSLKYPDESTAEKESGTLISFGPVLRYYFPTGKVLPFVEASGTLGSVSSKYESDLGKSKYKSSMNTLSLGAGITKSLSNKAALDFMLGYLSTSIKDKEDNPDNYRTVINSFGLKFGLVIFLDAKEKK